MTEVIIKTIVRIIDLYVLVLIINAILSWLIAFNVLNTQNRFVFSVLEFSYKLTDPPLNYIRKFIPNFGAVYISPVILILILWLIKDLILILL